MHTSDEIDRLFAPIAESVARFAKSEAFSIEKCPRGNSGWELTRPHDSGGALTLLLLYDESLGLGVGAVWQFPCPEMSNLYSHFRAIRPCGLTANEVVEALAKNLQELLQVPFGYWTHIGPLRASA